MKQGVTEDLLIRYILGEASEDEVQKVTSWIDASEANARQVEQTKFILDASRRLAQESPTTELEAWERFKANRDAKQAAAPVRSIKTFDNWIRVAATILVVMGIAWASYYFYTGSGIKPQGFVVIKTENKVLADTLPDGSIVHLNKHSSISYNGNFKSKREIRLTGEAFFNVIHNDKAPFTVHIGDVDVRDIGTAFNVSSNKKRIEVIVESGQVRVSRRALSIALEKEEMVSIKPGDQQLHPEKNSDVLYKYYRTNEFVANHTSLQRLIDMLNEAYSANIRIENNSLVNTPITGTFPNGSLDTILQVIILTTPEIHMQKIGNEIVLK